MTSEEGPVNCLALRVVAVQADSGLARPPRNGDWRVFYDLMPVVSFPQIVVPGFPGVAGICIVTDIYRASSGGSAAKASGHGQGLLRFSGPARWAPKRAGRGTDLIRELCVLKHRACEIDPLRADE